MQIDHTKSLSVALGTERARIDYSRASLTQRAGGAEHAGAARSFGMVMAFRHGDGIVNPFV
jgi:hypothetical protein